MPSKKEGFGIVFIEALLAECLVVAGNVDGSVDALQGGQTGILVNPDNIQEISIALDRVLSGEIPAHLQDKNRVKQKTLAVFGFAAFEQNLTSILNN